MAVFEAIFGSNGRIRDMHGPAFTGWKSTSSCEYIAGCMVIGFIQFTHKQVEESWPKSVLLLIEKTSRMQVYNKRMFLSIIARSSPWLHCFSCTSLLTIIWSWSFPILCSMSLNHCISILILFLISPGNPGRGSSIPFMIFLHSCNTSISSGSEKINVSFWVCRE